MKKVIAIIRTSTDKQEVDSQKQEVVSLVLSDGYTEEEIEIVGGAGASAIKLDEAYLANINKVYELIEAGGIESVYAWGIDRIGRNEEVLMQFKNRLINKKVQLVIKNPSLRLLNNDGSVNSGVEIAFSLFSTMAKQEMETKKARFHRGKKRNAESGKFNGGTVPFGYTLNDDGYYIPFEEEANSVKMAFELMASDKYSVSTLTEELRARGVIFNNRLITYQFVVAILKNTSYIGYRNKYAFNKKYPRLVSDELFNKVQEVLANNNSTKGKATKHFNFASLLIKCPVCGRNYIGSHGKKYVCSAHNSPSIRRTMGQKECDNEISIDLSHLDGLLWSISTSLHYEYIKGLDEQQKIDIAEQIRILELKKKESERRISEIAERFERLEDVYIGGRMTKARYEKNLSAIESDERTLSNELAGYDEEINRLNNILNSGGEKDKIAKWFDDNFLITELKAEENEKMMYDIVHKYITSISLERDELPADIKTGGDVIINGKPQKPTFKLGARKTIKITVTKYDGSKSVFHFIQNFRNANTKIIFLENGVAVPFNYEPIIRDGNGGATTESIIRSKDLVSKVGDWLRTDWSNKEDLFNRFFPICSHFHAGYSGDFSEVKETELREAFKSYHHLHKLRNFVLTMNTLNAIIKYYSVGNGKKEIGEQIASNITL